ncbi:M20 family metallopeptidase [Salinibacterium sp. M195]|uniref:M20 metallopeptidase family protein n=1 Tax=Salinibacterium sp. M195 TaxID=2583374 RepID=UPI001C62E15C|nr:M20 family metallopeptidase [Salinibacterium sp. M195]QYH35100.1 amidohydrolase [Salinibacterium sp. M195]
MHSVKSVEEQSLLLSKVDEQLSAAIELRHELHRNPALSGEEGPTADRIIAALDVSDFETVADTGRIVRIGPRTGPSIAIRAELDALPVHEKTGSPFASTNGGMHACGHDVHMAGAVALAKAAMTVDLPVALVFIFQPREESYPSGAGDIMDSGLLDAHDVRAVLGVHVHPDVPVGSVTTGAGVVNAASDEFRIVVEGTGGHSAYPHKSTDPIVTMAQIVSSVQTIVSRKIDPMNPVVVSFGSVHAGKAANVIPAMASASGSIRSSTAEDRLTIARELERTVRLVAEANNCTGTVEITHGEPVLSNDPELVGLVDPALQAQGFDAVEPMRSCGSDDFSFYSDVYPGLMMFLGTRTPTLRPDLTLHSADFLPDDESVAAVAKVLAAAYEALLPLVR